MPMLKFAHHVIAVANDNNVPVTNLQLHKVMYFSLQKALKEKILSKTYIYEMYDEPFLVWRYGPIVASIYDNYRIFGADPIVENDEPINEFRNLDDTIVQLLNENAFDLVNRSHQERFWRENESQIDGWRSNVAYRIRDIKKGGK